MARRFARSCGRCAADTIDSESPSSTKAVSLQNCERDGISDRCWILEMGYECVEQSFCLIEPKDLFNFGPCNIELQSLPCERLFICGSEDRVIGRNANIQIHQARAMGICVEFSPDIGIEAACCDGGKKVLTRSNQLDCATIWVVNKSSARRSRLLDVELESRRVPPAWVFFIYFLSRWSLPPASQSTVNRANTSLL